MKETLNNNLAELTKAVDKAILDIDEMETTIEEESARLDARLDGDGTETDEIYDAIYNDGVEAGIIEVNNAVQIGGARTNYSAAYMNWSTRNFRPQYDLKPTIAHQMFSTFYFDGELSQYFDDHGIVLDTSATTEIAYLFISCPYITRIGTISFAAISGNYPLVFHSCQSLTTIDKIVLHQNTAKTFDNLFIGVCPKLTHLRIEGVIGATGFNVSWSPLDKTSLTSIVNALSATTAGLTVTLRLSAVNTAFETSEGIADGSTSDEWLALAATKSNWTISLINS